MYRHLRDAFGAAQVLPVARASLGLMASLQVWRAGGHAPVVALCANVCHDVVAAVLGAGMRPLFLDMDPASGQVPESEWRRARAQGASVALVVHLYGNPSDVAMVRRHFPAGDALLVDDAAQALGVQTPTGAAGGLGDIGLLSFGPTKHISTGGAALLFRASTLAQEVHLALQAIPMVSVAEADRMRAQFRKGLERARQQLRDTAGQDTAAFAGLLDGYTPSLSEWPGTVNPEATWQALQGYASARQSRCDKAALWAQLLRGTGLESVGMGPQSVPWRFVCRLPGLAWADQHRLGQSMRQAGLDVSHWYLPAHWMCGEVAGSLPGVERLAREVFQFWLDDASTLESIRAQAGAVHSLLETLP